MSTLDIQEFNRQVRKHLRSINRNNVCRMNGLIRPLGLTPSQLVILIHLEHHGELTISELVEQTEHPKSNVSAICSRLEENGMIRRTRSAKDQRVVYISMTEQARQTLATAKHALDAEQDRLAERLTDTEREEILRGLSLLSKMND